jgi:hypothetical protein
MKFYVLRLVDWLPNAVRQTNQPKHIIDICIARLRNPTLTNREKNCRQGRFAAETRQSRGRQRIS